MIRNFSPISVSFIFLVINIIILLTILHLNQRTSAKSEQPTTPVQKSQDQASQDQKRLNASDILGWEFEYARTTASEAMQDRHTMINYYLLVAGVLTSGVVVVRGQDVDLPKAAGTILLWLLCGIGWLYFLKIIRLRQAWHDSAKVMNQIKDLYIQYANGFDHDALSGAFRWQSQSLPAPDKPWTLYFFSAMLIGFLDSVAYVSGGALIDLEATLSFPWLVIGLLVLFGLLFFAFHVWLYFAFLKEASD